MTFIYHNHHYLPKHAGGTDHPSNIVKVTIQEHASLHYERWVLCGDPNDHIAWLGLSGMIPKEEAIKHSLKLGRIKTDLYIQQQYGVTNIMHVEAFIKKAQEGRKSYYQNNPDLISDFRSEHTRSAAKEGLMRKYGVDNPSKLEHVKAIISSKSKQHQSKSGNSQWGTMWITNGTKNVKIKKTDPLPIGYRPGRKMERVAGNAPVLSSLEG
jgi:hypothetical protein